LDKEKKQRGQQQQELLAGIIQGRRNTFRAAAAALAMDARVIM